MYYHQEKEYLPWTNQAYSIDPSGVVRKGEHLVETQVIDGERMIELDWYDGKRLYRYDIIPGVCYFKIQIPVKFLDRVALIYKDLDKNNLAIDNLAYHFIDGPIESDDFPGYYYVPYYTLYVINREGDTYSLKRFGPRARIRHKKWTVSKPGKKNIKGGYYCGRAIRDYDGVNGSSRHRFLALTFLSYLTDPMALTVNHRDGIPGNDRLTNLEWVTYSENTKHAYQNNLYPNKVVKVVYIDGNKGTETHYPTLQECANDTGFSIGFITGRINKVHVDYRDGIRVKLDDGSDWPKLTEVSTPSFTQPVMVKNVFTKDITIFESAAKAQEETGILRATISFHCHNKPMTPTRGLSFRFLNDCVMWPYDTEYHLRMYRRFPEQLIARGIFLLDDSGNIVTFYECADEFSKVNNLVGNEGDRILNKIKMWNGLHVRKFDPRGPL